MIFTQTMDEVIENGLRQSMARCETLERENLELDRLNGLLFQYIEERVGEADPINADKYQEIERERRKWQESPPSKEPQD